MRKIIFWLPQGRLGNLLFQYQAVTSIFRNNETIITIDVGFLSLFKNDRNVTFIKLPSILAPRILTWWVTALRMLKKWKIFSGCSPRLFSSLNGFQDECDLVEYQQGFFSDVIVFDGFFQNELYTKELPAIRNDQIEFVRTQMYFLPAKKMKIAVHLRFGDYCEISVLGKKDASLPASYYWQCMKKMRKIFHGCIFLIFSDDLERAKSFFLDFDDLIFFKSESEQSDFLAISLCDSAIISASTFSWWAARYINNPDRIVMAPKYWMGFRSKVWFPKYLKSSSFLYLPVKSK
jgi:Glycosyl transferase family 11